MVQARAGYAFGDFFLLGSLVTAVVGVVACTIILVVPPELLPATVGAAANGSLAGAVAGTADGSEVRMASCVTVRCERPAGPS